MARIVRWDPFREMMALRRDMDRLMDESLGGNSWDEASQWELPLDVKETEDEYTVQAALPGVKPDEIEITYNNGMLTIQAETHAEQEKKEERILVRERRFGTFSRSINLPSAVDANKIQADYNDGVLTLHLPKSEEVKPKRIPIQSGSKNSEKMIDAHATNGKK